MLNATYARYQSVYGGTMISSAMFDNVMRQAFTYVRRATRGRADREQSNRVQSCIDDACYAIAEILYRDAQGPTVISESVGKWSRSFATTQRTVEQEVAKTIKLYLSGTGLTYKGVM